ncbi:MAG: DUF4339 domain-containing protein [Nitrospiraceae bacterium]|nr:DUF4339 domain-containing protein [Nitrospiraceae bacterium]
MAEWYYDREGEQQGPVSEDTLHELIAAREVLPGNLVWTAGMEQWATAGETFNLPGAPDDSHVPPINAATAQGRSVAAAEDAQEAVMQRKTNGFAVACLAAGCLGILFSSAAFIAIAFGCVALVQIKRAPERYSGRGLAISGLVLAGLKIVSSVLLLGYALLSFVAH